MPKEWEEKNYLPGYPSAHTQEPSSLMSLPPVQKPCTPGIVAFSFNNSKLTQL